MYRVFGGVAAFISGGDGAARGVGFASNIAAIVGGSVIVVAMLNCSAANANPRGVIVILNSTDVVDGAVSNNMVVAIDRDSEVVVV